MSEGIRAVCLLRKIVVISVQANASVIDIKRSTTSACMMFVGEFERKLPCGILTSLVRCHAATILLSLSLPSMCV